jgi:hypothetical protein
VHDRIGFHACVSARREYGDAQGDAAAIRSGAVLGDFEGPAPRLDASLQRARRQRYRRRRRRAQWYEGEEDEGTEPVSAQWSTIALAAARAIGDGPVASADNYGRSEAGDASLAPRRYTNQ